MTDEELELVARYMPLINIEMRRIGFTDEDFRILGSGGHEITREGLEAHLAKLQTIPSGIGANAYYARYGVDFAALKPDAEKLREEWQAE